MVDQRRYRAPGRVNLIGEHTDHSGGLVLPAAIDRAIHLAATPGGARIRLTSAGAPDAVDVPADGAAAPDDGWGRYVAAVAAELAELGRAPVGLTGRLRSDLPQGAGLSSSAALEVAVGVALCDVAGFDVDPLELAAVGQRAEQRAVGVPVGIMDQAASLLGRADHAVQLDCGTLEHRIVPLPVDLALVVVDSGVSRRLEGSAYGERRRELERATAALGGRRPQDLDVGEAEALARRAGVDEVAVRRLRHVVTENARVRAVVAALTRADGADRDVLGRLFAEGHASLRDDFEVSVPELDLLVELARDAGAVAARMTGGGFGGAIVALVPVDHAASFGEEVGRRYAASAPGRRATVHHCRAADGAARIG